VKNISGAGQQTPFGDRQPAERTLREEARRLAIPQLVERLPPGRHNAAMVAKLRGGQSRMLGSYHAEELNGHRPASGWSRDSSPARSDLQKRPSKN
jgi:hypothetical protein